MKAIPLPKGYVAIVDDEDYESLSQFKWGVGAQKKNATVYAFRRKRQGGKQVSILMHREIAGALKDEQVDHRNHCGIDNRKVNLRRVSVAQNQQNRRPRNNWKNKLSKYKGVTFQTSRRGPKKWRAIMKVNGKNKHIGWFENECDAARAYNNAALAQYGEYAFLNDVSV